MSNNIVVKMLRKHLVKVLVVLFCVILSGFLVPEPRVIPVAHATSTDWNSNTFWYEPWGSSGVHKLSLIHI